MSYKIKFITRTDRIFYKLDRENKLIEQGYKCYFCGCKLKKSEATTDHLLSLSKTNRVHSSRNTVVACSKCNGKKSDKDDYEPDWFDVRMAEIHDRLEERIKQAEWRLSIEPKGSYKKWKKYWEKQGRWN